MPSLYSGITISEDEGVVTVLLYNLSGEVVGYQTYNPGAPKVHIDDYRLARYFTWVSRNDKHAKLAVWGLETVNWLSDTVFLTEGIFDASRLHWHGIPALAVLGNNPSHLTTWLNTMPWKTVSCVQGDKAGRKLGKHSNHLNILLPESKDVGDLTDSEFNFYFKDWIK